MASSNGITVSLLIPGMAAFNRQEWRELMPHAPTLPGLSGLLNRGRRTRKTPCSYESLLAEKFSVTTSTPLPVAALTYLYDKLQPTDRYVLRADPVYLKADRDCLYLLGRDGLNVALAEAELLAAEINQLYANDGWTLEIGAPDRWYICIDKNLEIETSPLHEVFGKNISMYLPRGQDQKQWRVVLTELQMLLHNSEVNTRRIINQSLPINSVWLWGGGRLSQLAVGHPAKFDCIWSNDSLCLGLAQWANCPHDSLPLTASDWIEHLRPGRHLLAFEDLRVLARENFQSWADKLSQFDEQWFTPLMEAFDNKLLANIHIEMETGTAFDLVKPSIWNKWRRKKRLWYELS